MALFETLACLRLHLIGVFNQDLASKKLLRLQHHVLVEVVSRRDSAPAGDQHLVDLGFRAHWSLQLALEKRILARNGVRIQRLGLIWIILGHSTTLFLLILARLDYTLVVVVGQLADDRRLLVEVDVLAGELVHRLRVDGVPEDVSEEGH